MRTLWFWGILLVGSVPPCGAEEDYDRRMLWFDKQHTRAMFLPEAVLNENPLEVLSIRSTDREALEWEIAFRRNWPPAIPLGPPGRGSPCSVPSIGPAGSRTDAADLVGLVRRNELTVVGKVVDLVPGWSVELEITKEALYIVIDTVLEDDTGELKPGDVRTFLEMGGEMNVQGVRLCTDPYRGFYVPRVGDRVLVTGFHWPEEPIFLSGEAFVVERDVVKPRPYPVLLDQREWKLAEITALLGPK